MYSSSLLVLALAVFGASAQTLISSGCGLNGLVGGVSGINGGLIGGVSGINNGLVGGVSGINGGLIGDVSSINSGIVGGVSGINGGLIGGVSGINNGLVGVNTGVVASTPVIENVPLRLPSIVQPTTVQESCNCLKTIVRPQLRKEVYTIPSVQRFIQTTSTPVVETVPYVTGSAADVPAVAGVESGIIGGVSGLGSSGFGVSGLGSSGFGVSGLGVSGLGVSGVLNSVNSVNTVNTGCGRLSGLVSGVNTY